MKICHITYDFTPTKGGVETHNYSLVKYLLKEGYDVDVIVLRSTLSKVQIAKASATINKGIKVHDIFPKPFPFWIFQVRKEIKKIEKDGKIDVFDIHSINHVFPFVFHQDRIVYSLHYFELNCPGPHVNPWPRPYIYSFKKCYKCCGIRKYIEWKFTRWFALRKTTKFMVKYDYLKKLLMKMGIDGEKIEIVPHWIDGETVNEKAKIKGILINKIKPSDYIFVFFGRLAKEKGPDLLLDAFFLLTRKLQNIKLVFIGDGLLRCELEETCKKYDIKDKVIFLGMQPHEKLFEYISSADTIVFPHRYFNYEWVLLEAMYTEKSIIATDVPATRDILRDGYNALLAEPTVKSLSMKMQEILDNPKLAKKIVKNSLETVREKHGYGNLRKYEEMIHSL